MYLVHTVRADLTRIRAGIENKQIEYGKYRKASEEPSERSFGRFLSCYVEFGKKVLEEHEEVGKVGALIVMERNVPLDNIVRTGDTIDANVNQRLIENIFFKNSPLHDGAMVISNKRIKAAGCILPVSHDLDIPKELG